MIAALASAALAATLGTLAVALWTGKRLPEPSEVRYRDHAGVEYPTMGREWTERQRGRR